MSETTDTTHGEMNLNPNDPKNAPERKTLMAVLSYLGPLVIVSYLTSKDDPFVKFHIQQGLVLLTIEIAITVLGSIALPLWGILEICNLATLVLSILGIINAIQGKQKNLPLIGDWSKHFTI